MQDRYGTKWQILPTTFSIFPEHWKTTISLQWRHNEGDGVSNHQTHDSLLAIYSGADQRKHQSSASRALCVGIHRWPVNSPHKGSVARKMFPFDDVIICATGVVAMATPGSANISKVDIMGTFWFSVCSKIGLKIKVNACQLLVKCYPDGGVNWCHSFIYTLIDWVADYMRFRFVVFCCDYIACTCMRGCLWCIHPGAHFTRMDWLKIITTIIKCGMKLLIHFQTSTFAPSKFGMGN